MFALGWRSYCLAALRDKSVPGDVIEENEQYNVARKNNLAMEVASRQPSRAT
jgi:hypothetical protein